MIEAMAKTRKRGMVSQLSMAGCLLLALSLFSSMSAVSGNNYNNDAYSYYTVTASDDGNDYDVDDKAFYYNGGQGNYNRYYANTDDDASSNGYNYQEAYTNYHNYGNNNNNNYNSNDDANDDANSNSNNDDANANNDDANANNDDANANNDDANGNDDGKAYYNYDYEMEVDDQYDKQFQDDIFDFPLDSFDDVSISPVSCVN